MTYMVAPSLSKSIWQALRLPSSLRQARRVIADSALRRIHSKWSQRRFFCIKSLENCLSWSLHVISFRQMFLRTPACICSSVLFFLTRGFPSPTRFVQLSPSRGYVLDRDCLSNYPHSMTCACRTSQPFL